MKAIPLGGGKEEAGALDCSHPKEGEGSSDNPFCEKREEEKEMKEVPIDLLDFSRKREEPSGELVTELVSKKTPKKRREGGEKGCLEGGKRGKGMHWGIPWRGRKGEGGGRAPSSSPRSRRRRKGGGAA